MIFLFKSRTVGPTSASALSMNYKVTGAVVRLLAAPAVQRAMDGCRIRCSTVRFVPISSKLRDWKSLADHDSTQKSRPSIFTFIVLWLVLSSSHQHHLSHIYRQFFTPRIVSNWWIAFCRL